MAWRQPGGPRRDPARTKPIPGQRCSAWANGQLCAQSHPARSAHRLRPPSQPAWPLRRTPRAPRISPRDSERPSPRHSPHRPKAQFPIDRCQLIAGSFFPDFRTPSAPETLQGSGLTAFGRSTWKPDTGPRPRWAKSHLSSQHPGNHLEWMLPNSTWVRRPPPYRQ